MWTDGDGLHLVHSEYDSNNDEYDTFYRKVAHDGTQWNDFKKVTDEANVDGGFPSVTTSNNRVHVTFTAGNDQDPVGNRGIAKTRDLSSSTWQSSYQLFDDAARSMVIATSDKLHGFYYDFVPVTYNLHHKTRSLTGSTWSGSSTQLITNSDPSEPIAMAVTNDDKLHVVYDPGKYREWDGSWSDAFGFGGYVSQRIAANSNDVYAVWIEFGTSDFTIKMRQRDFAPLAPAGITPSIVNTANNPRIDWDANAEADIDEYEVWKNKDNGGWNQLATTSNTYYIDNTESGVDFAQFSNNIEILYKLKAVDLGNNKSGFSGTVTFNQKGGGLEKIASNGSNDQAPKTFTLAQNYPNPFNPATTITFSLPKQSHVQLTVFDLNGRQVAKIINRELPEGSYSLPFDASHLASGTYLYRLSAGQNFTQTRKMMLIK